MTLKTYAITRLLLAIPMTLLLLTGVFITLHIIPGDPIRAMLGPKASESYVQELKHKLGLDRPLYVQYTGYLTSLLHGDLGISLWSHRKVTDELLQAFPVTLELTISAMFLSVLIGIPLGVISALKRNKLVDFIIRFISLAGFSIPIFWLGLMLQWSLGLSVGIFPIQGRFSPLLEPPWVTGFATIDAALTGNLNIIIDAIMHLGLPSSALAIYISPIICRISRANMIETLNDDYILTARAKGLRERTIIYKHALRNAILPVFTVTGLYFALLLGGAVLTETIFGLPGMGRLLIDSIFRRDYAVIQGCVTLYAIAVVMATTIVDIFYALLDPRIRFKERS